MPKGPRKLVSYRRVSTDRQGKSGLGLEAQREAVQRFVSAEGCEIVAELVEVEAGKGGVRQLQSSGTTSLAGTANALNERGVRTPQDPTWRVSSVRNLLARA